MLCTRLPSRWISSTRFGSFLGAASGVVLGVLLGASGCSKGEAPPRSMLTADEASAARASCTFASGTLPGLSLAKDAPLGDQIPIDHVVVLMLENRSFDHVFGDLRTTQPDADVAPPDSANPDANGVPVPVHHLEEYCFGDTDHSWGGTRVQYDDGKNDGFVRSNAGDPNDARGERAMGYYTSADLPILNWAANEFSIGDRYFCSLLGPTFPNRLFFYAATSFGYIDNVIIGEQTQNLMELLEGGKVSWKVYSEAIPGPGILIRSVSKYLAKHFVQKLDPFYADAAAGQLAAVTLLDPDLSETQGGAQDDQHPPGDVQLADAIIAKVIQAVMQSPQWAHTALFITYDEHGGIYDHVAPPPACAPDSTPPMITAGMSATPAFDRLGFRVPMVVISPYAKRHYVSHEVYDHTSILRFIEARFNLPAMTARDANAAPLFDLFDFDHANTAASAMPAVVVDEAKRTACAAMYPPSKQ
jgi:phospholipase C